MFIRHAQTELNKAGIFAGRTDCSITKEIQYTPPRAETTSQVDRRVCEFIESLFNKYKNNEKILIVTHNGVMRSIKRNFVKNYDNIMSENLGHILLTDENYKYYLEKLNSKENTR